MTVKCPTCGEPARFEPGNLFRPFCSERCQTLDLGAWADEQYRVPLEVRADEQESLPVNENSESKPHLN